MGQREIDAAQLADAEKFEDILAQYLAGDIEEDVFRIFRLNNGIYGQRQGGHNQMVRVKIPWGGMLPDQLELMAHLADTYSRGWGHITTRQNVQFHYVQLEKIPEVMRLLGTVGLTSREACGDTVRNVMACHLAGACPHEQLDVTPWAEAAFQHFVRNPLGQRLPRKFKINFSGCATDCGQAMFNDVGVIAATRTLDDGSVERGFRVFVAGGLGANPHPALALEEFTSREDLMPTIEAVLRVFNNHGNRDNKLRARMKWLVDTLGWDDVQARVIKERRLLLGSSSWPGGIPAEVDKAGDAPAGVAADVDATAHGPGRPGEDHPARPVRAVGRRQRRARRRQGHGVGHRLRPPRRRHQRPVPGPRRHPARDGPRGAPHQPPERRLPRPHRGAAPGALRAARRHRHGPARAPSWSATSSPAPAPTPATSPSPRAAASAPPSARSSRRRAWPRSAACASTSRAAPTAAASTTRPTSGSSAPSAGPTAARPPATRCCSAATSARSRSTSATRRCACRPRTPPRPRCGSSAGSPTSARPASPSATGWTGPAAPRRSPPSSRSSTSFPSPDEAPEYYVDYDETGPYEAEVGAGECAGV